VAESAANHNAFGADDLPIYLFWLEGCPDPRMRVAKAFVEAAETPASLANLAKRLSFKPDHAGRRACRFRQGSGYLPIGSFAGDEGR